jgi:hypothetical protein
VHEIGYASHVCLYIRVLDLDLSFELLEGDVKRATCIMSFCQTEARKEEGIRKRTIICVRFERLDHWGTDQTCLSSDDVSDSHLVVVDDRSKVVRGELIGLEEDGIGWQRSMSIPQSTKDNVMRGGCMSS